MSRVIFSINKHLFTGLFVVVALMIMSQPAQAKTWYHNGLEGLTCVGQPGTGPFPPDPQHTGAFVCLDVNTVAAGQVGIQDGLFQRIFTTVYQAQFIITGDTGSIVSGSTTTTCGPVGAGRNLGSISFITNWGPGSHTLTSQLVACAGDRFFQPGELLASTTVTFNAVASTPSFTGADPDLGPCKQCEAQVGAPINTGDGNTWMQEHDYVLPGFSVGLQVTRTWNSLWPNQNPPEEVGIFGDSWRSNFEERLQGSRGDISVLNLWRGDGSVWQFTYDSVSQTYLVSNPPDARATIALNPTSTQFILTEKNGTQEVFSKQGDTLDGFLIQIIDRNGNALNLQWDQSITPPALTSVTDAAQRTLTFAHNPNSRLVTSISDAMGTIASYTYSSDGNNLLTSVTYPVSTNPAVNIVKSFQYNDLSSPTLISAVVDGAGAPIESHTYDGSRRGLTSQRGTQGAELVRVSYPSSGTLGVLVTNSVQQGSVLNFGYIGTRAYLMSGGGPGCSSCGLKNATYFSYDAAGNRASVTDARQNRTSYTYDPQGNVTSASRSYTDSQAQAQTATWSYTYNNFGEV